MQRDPPTPPYRVLVVSDDNALVQDLDHHLSYRPVVMHFVEGGAAARTLLQIPGLRFLAIGPATPDRIREQLPKQKRFEIVEIGDVDAVGAEEACKAVLDVMARAGSQGGLGVGVIGVPELQHLAIETEMRRTSYQIATAFSREEALDRDLVGSSDLVLLDAKLGQIDGWSFALEILEIDSGSGLPVFGIVPRIGADVLQQSSNHRMAGFLLRTLIDERLYPRLEAVARSGARVRPVGMQPDSRFRAPTTLEWKRDLDDHAAQGSGYQKASEVFEAIASKPGDLDARAVSLVGQTFGKVELTRVIGRGGSGTVYYGRHRTLDTSVAVKVLFAEDVARDERFAHRFIEEARIAARIEHPGAVRVIDFDRDDESGCYYLVMELVRGVTLLDVLRDQGSVAQDMILDIAERVSEVLAVASGLGIVHRDISPANILITETGVVKLADLGIAKFIDDPRSRDLVDGKQGEDAALGGSDEELVEALHSVPVRTATGVLLGTPLYISPEQSRDARLVDFRCDMYSLGATLYHAAAGHPPFSGLTIGDIVLHHRESEAPDLCEVRPGISPEVAVVISRLLEKEPAQRFPSFERLIEEIRLCRRTINEREIVHGLVGKGWRGRMMRWLGLRTRRFRQRI